MNIKRAKEEIEHTVKAYLAKDALGEYAIPAIRQRPILLMGPPGIGKTQVMEQVARECGVALVAYTITHHTRQSAVGLPFIRQRHYGDKDVSVTEYTMSEIIASVYAKMEATGLSEGILFIDEINCVSETLAPTMLQFLQCKTFGNQAVPAGWVIVAAGNPPEYNKSVRDFDIVTLDRVRRMDIRARPLGLERLRPRGPHPQRHPELSGAAPAELLPDQRRCGRHPVCHRPRLGGPLQPAGHLRDAGPEKQTKTSSGSTSSTRRSPRTSRPTWTSTTSTATITVWKTFWPGRSSLLSTRGSSTRPLMSVLSLVSLILAGLDTRFTASRQQDAVADACYAFLRQAKQGFATVPEDIPDGPAVYFSQMVADYDAETQKQRAAGLLSRDALNTRLAGVCRSPCLGDGAPPCQGREHAARV